MTSSSRRRRGFALPAVLTVTGVVTLVFMVAITALASLTAEAAAARSRINFLQRALTLEANIAYLAVTEPLEGRGLAVGGIRRFNNAFDDPENEAAPPEPEASEIALDGTLYSVDLAGPMTVALRDQAGTINLNQMSADQWRTFGERAGVSRSELDSLRPRFRDYVDSDRLETGDGGESAAYGGSGPPNRPLLRPTEWLSVVGARRAVSPQRWRALREEISADQTQVNYNINTASATTLEILFGLTPRQAERALESRREAPFITLSDLAGATGAILRTDDGSDTFYAFPSSKILFTLSDGRSSWVYRGRLSMTPSNAERPVWIDQTDLMESPRNKVADTTNATPLPYPIR